MPSSLRALIASALVIGVTTMSGQTVGSASSRVPASPVAKIWVEPQAGYGFVTQAVLGAHHRIDLSIYELSDPTLEHELIARARAGVTVRVLLNAAYFGTTHNAGAVAAFRGTAVRVAWAPSNQIFHAKYMVVDGTAAYIGSGNLVADDYTTTRDFWALDTSRDDVAAIQSTFDADFARTGTTARASAGLVWSPASTSALVAVIASAQRTLLVENEEMNNATIEEALVADARRGVSVEVVMTIDTAWTSALEQLAAAGVHVRELPLSLTYIHAKVLCADCTGTLGTAFLGSENFSTSSLSYNRELGVVTRSPIVLNAIRSTVTADFTSGSPLSAFVGGVTPTSASASSPPVAGRDVSITSLTTPIAPGQSASLRAHSSRPHDECSLTVVLASGYASASKGLGPASANAQGDVAWTWLIGTRTGAGTARATVTCSAGTATATFDVT